jgi:hypothetical protein
MSQDPRHRPQRQFPNAQRKIVECELDVCLHCGQPLLSRKPWHMRISLIGEKSNPRHCNICLVSTDLKRYTS